MTYRIILCISLLLFLAIAEATEVGGTITLTPGVGANGALVKIVCKKYGYKQSRNISATGNYRVSDVPDNQVCELHITYQEFNSSLFRFNSNSGKLTLNRQISVYGSRLVAIPK